MHFRKVPAVGRWNGKAPEKLEIRSAVRKPWCQMRESNQPDEEVQSRVHPISSFVQILRMMGRSRHTDHFEREKNTQSISIKVPHEADSKIAAE